jgi:hypothetical protein
MVKTVAVTAVIIDVYCNVFGVASPRAVAFIVIIFFNYNISVLVQSFGSSISINVGKNGTIFGKI